LHPEQRFEKSRLIEGDAEEEPQGTAIAVLTLEAPSELPVKCRRNRCKSSRVAVSGERPMNRAKFSTHRI
jgi:hypothetical protein